MLDIRNLSKNFKKKEVLKDLCLTVPDKSIVGLVGINGAGKSTLLRSIAGVYAPEKGSITLDGKSTYYDMETKKKIAFVSDEAYFPMGSSINSIKLFYECMYDFDKSAFSKYLSMFELDPKASISTFSKGMKRQTLLLFALAIRPKLLLLDEPAAGMNPNETGELMDTIRFIRDEFDMTVILIEHDMKLVSGICDRLTVLNFGRILAEGETKAVLNDPEVIKAYLGD